MGSNMSKHSEGREQYTGSGLYVLSHPIHNPGTTTKPPTKRMEKIIIWAFNTGYGAVVLLNIENVKGAILFIIAVLYGIARLFFYVVKQNQDRRMRELDILEKQKKVGGVINSA